MAEFTGHFGGLFGTLWRTFPICKNVRRASQNHVKPLRFRPGVQAFCTADQNKSAPAGRSDAVLRRSNSIHGQILKEDEKTALNGSCGLPANISRICPWSAVPLAVFPRTVYKPPYIVLPESLATSFLVPSFRV